MGAEANLLDWANFLESFVKWKINPTGAHLKIRKYRRGS